MNVVFPASLDKLYTMLQLIEDQSDIAGFDRDAISKIELAVEEALVNIIKHGYSHAHGTIEISIHLFDSGIKIVLKDQGIPYNPLNFRTVDPKAKCMEHQLGGYGIYIILNIMDEIEYQRIGNQNILTLIKYH